ncbi:MAG: GyrI-like domain-containing protein [Gemmatimonadetes bacterium]|nr:GyrI-like domain-containing protein [Gemmatimonadota bacterium]
MTMAEIKVVTLEPRPFVGVRRTVPHTELGAMFGEALPRVGQWCAENGVRPTSMPISVYHSVNQETHEFDVQPGFFVAETGEQDGDISFGETAGGEALMATHVGPYETLGETWQAVFAKAAEMGRSVSKSSWESYVDDPGEVEKAQLRTEIYVPIDPA